MVGERMNAFMLEHTLLYAKEFLQKQLCTGESRSWLPHRCGWSCRAWCWSGCRRLSQTRTWALQQSGHGHAQCLRIMLQLHPWWTRHPFMKQVCKRAPDWLTGVGAAVGLGVGACQGHAHGLYQLVLYIHRSMRSGALSCPARVTTTAGMTKMVALTHSLHENHHTIHCLLLKGRVSTMEAYGQCTCICMTGYFLRADVLLASSHLTMQCWLSTSTMFMWRQTKYTYIPVHVYTSTYWSKIPWYHEHALVNMDLEQHACTHKIPPMINNHPHMAFVYEAMHA
jgi:hypothetical protein